MRFCERAAVLPQADKEVNQRSATSAGAGKRVSDDGVFLNADGDDWRQIPAGAVLRTRPWLHHVAGKSLEARDPVLTLHQANRMDLDHCYRGSRRIPQDSAQSDRYGHNAISGLRFTDELLDRQSRK